MEYWRHAVSVPKAFVAPSWAQLFDCTVCIFQKVFATGRDLTGTVTRAPQTQNNLGLALARLGERESGTARLEEAVAAFRAALEEMTP